MKQNRRWVFNAWLPYQQCWAAPAAQWRKHLRSSVCLCTHPCSTWGLETRYWATENVPSPQPSGQLVTSWAACTSLTYSFDHTNYHHTVYTHTYIPNTQSQSHSASSSWSFRHSPLTNGPRLESLNLQTLRYNYCLLILVWFLVACDFIV